MEEAKKVRKNSLVLQGSILVIASIVVRLIGFFYRIPLINMLGNEGMGNYSVAFNIYSTVLIISSYGIPIAVSKLIASKMSTKEYKNAHRLFISSLIFAFITGSIGASVVWFGAEFFATLLEMPLAFYALRTLSPTILIVAILGVFRGYFQGMNTMVPTALSQVIEQIINAIISIVAAAMLLHMGPHFGAAGGTIGTGAGALAGLIFIIIIYLMAKPMIHNRINRDQHSREIPYPQLLKVIALTISPIVIGSSVFHITNTVDDIMFNQALAFHGSSHLIEALNGILNGKYKVIITLPVSLGSALAAATVPSIAASIHTKQLGEVNKKIDVAIRFLMLLAIPSVVGIFVLAGPILNMLFRESEVIVTHILKIGSISIVFFCLSTIAIGILQGLGHIHKPVKHSAMALFIKVIFNVLLLFMFNTNLYGAVITNIIFAFVSAYLNLKSVKKITKFKFNVQKTFIYPTIASLIMGAIAFVTYHLTYLLVQRNAISTLFAIFIAFIVYGLFIIKLKAVDADEIKTLPKGAKIVALCNRIGLLN